MPRRNRFASTVRVAFVLLGALALAWSFRVFTPPLAAQAPKEDQSGRDDDYNQWKLSLATGTATDPKSFAVPEGYRVELVRSAGKDEGSWIALTFDPKGRAIISREDKGLWRLTWDESSDPRQPASNQRLEAIDDSLLECRGLLWAHDSLYANANNSKALYRLRDTNGDDRFDEVKLLRATSGGVGHGRNDLTLGPDGSLYLIHGDDVRLPADFDPAGSPLRNVTDSRLFPCSWDKDLFNAAMVLPGGHVIRTDRDGKSWELVAGGLRNPYGIDFNGDGELFTFDADMEWDVGMPWYRPTRVLHLTSGADFGWRHGTGAWPAWFPDSLPTTYDAGLGSPTAVRFGAKTNFPAPRRESLFIADWSYGRILAVQLRPNGASYTATAEPFVTGRPLNVTDLEVGPDGALYFLTGGRRTQSGLYRIKYVGGEKSVSTTNATAPELTAERQAAATARQLRRQLETFHVRQDPAALDVAWPVLDSPDPWLRHAARVAVERQPAGEWLERAWNERRPTARAVGLLAAARVASVDSAPRLLAELTDYPWSAATPQQQTIALRGAALGLARHGRPDADRVAALRAAVEPIFPSKSAEVNFLACELLAYLASPTVVPKTLDLLSAARHQEEKLRYLYVLRLVREPWTLVERRRYFTGLRQAREFYGAHFLPRFIAWIKTDAEATLSDAERADLKELLADEPAPSPVATPTVARPHVRNWIFQDLVGSLDADWSRRDPARGKAAFEAALCAKCHRYGGAGSFIGPDLTGVSRRFGRREILLSILHPSQVIDEKYQAVTVTTMDGQIVTGQRMSETAEQLVLAPNPLVPEQLVRIAKTDIESQRPSHVSPMPAGLLNSLSKDEIVDLLAYLTGP